MHMGKRVKKKKAVGMENKLAKITERLIKNNKELIKYLANR